MNCFPFLALTIDDYKSFSNFSGQIYRAKGNKSPIHRDRSLSKLVAMSRRLESQVRAVGRYVKYLSSFFPFCIYFITGSIFSFTYFVQFKIKETKYVLTKLGH